MCALHLDSSSFFYSHMAWTAEDEEEQTDYSSKSSQLKLKLRSNAQVEDASIQDQCAVLRCTY
jgi:hypothetical protein